MMKYMKDFLKVLLVFLGIILLLALAMLFHTKIIESRASEFCHAAMTKDNVEDVRDLLTTTKGVDHPIFFENVAIIEFPIWAVARYDCIVELDESGKPFNMEVIFKD